MIPPFKNPFRINVGFASDEILSLYSPEIKKRVRIGDILISYNGLSFEDFFKNHAHLTGGSNEWGGKRSAMDYMSFIDFNQYPLIKETQVVYELKRKATDAKSFIVKAPILGVTDTHCLESMHSSSRTTGTSSSTPSPAPPTKKRNSEDHDERVVHDMDLVELDDNDYNEDNDENDITAQLKKLLRHDKKRHRHSKSKPSPRNRRLRVPQTQELLQSLDLQSSSSTSSTTSFGRSYSRLRKRDRKNDLILSPTIDPSIHWTIYRHNSFKLGIIQLSTFDPVIDQSGSTTLHVIRHLLVNQLKGTHGLVFDVRDNGGGLIYIADMIPQFFSPSFEPTRFRALNSPLNRQLFESEDLANTE